MLIYVQSDTNLWPHNIEGLDKKVDRLEMMINEVHSNGAKDGST